MQRGREERSGDDDVMIVPPRMRSGDNREESNLENDTNEAVATFLEREHVSTIIPHDDLGTRATMESDSRRRIRHYPTQLDPSNNKHQTRLPAGLSVIIRDRFKNYYRNLSVEDPSQALSAIQKEVDDRVIHPSSVSDLVRTTGMSLKVESRKDGGEECMVLGNKRVILGDMENDFGDANEVAQDASIPKSVFGCFGFFFTPDCVSSLGR